jgi:hypothetical protein
MAPKRGQVEKELTGEELEAQQHHNKLLKQAVAKGVSKVQSLYLPCVIQQDQARFILFSTRCAAAAAVACLALSCSR